MCGQPAISPHVMHISIFLLLPLYDLLITADDTHHWTDVLADGRSLVHLEASTSAVVVVPLMMVVMVQLAVASA